MVYKVFNFRCVKEILGLVEFFLIKGIEGKQQKSKSSFCLEPLAVDQLNVTVIILLVYNK